MGAVVRQMAVGWGLRFVAACLFCVGPQAWAASDLPEPSSKANPFVNFTDAELTLFTRVIDSLNAEQRRAFFTEYRRRMVVNGRRPRVHTQARFGRIIQNSDGSLTRIETVRIYEHDGTGYGRGLDPNLKSEAVANLAATPRKDIRRRPVITVGDPSRSQRR